MEQTTFFDYYRVCRNEDGSAQEISRTGATVIYKAIDTRTEDSVALQLVPVASVDPSARAQFEEHARTAQKLDHINIVRVLQVGVEHDYVAVVSEFVEGETADSWLVSHGPMPADAVLRVGLQVVRALSAASFHGLTHRAIQPSNLLIVPGQTADGGWPFAKLLNFGWAGIETHTDGKEASEVATSLAPQFASPEQLLNKPLDFRSEVYSLGASMCFLLTGAIPLAVGGMKARLHARRLPELRRAPKALRDLLVHMLRENPDNRPQDPVAFETEIRDCLTKVERRQAIGRKLGIPMAAVIPRSTSARGPIAQVGRGILAFAALLLAGGVVAAFLLPEDSVPFLHRKADNIGVPVGVPDRSTAQNPSTTTVAVASPAAVNSPGPVVVANQSAPLNIPPVQPISTPPPVAAAASPTQNETSMQVASANRNTEPPPPAKGPEQDSPAAANSIPPTSSDNNNSPADVSAQASANSVADAPNQSNSVAKNEQESPLPPAVATRPESTTSTTTSTTTRRSTSKRPRVATAGSGPRLPAGSVRAQYVGMTPEGRVILRLPSGETVVASPRSEARHPRRRVIERREEVGEPVAPHQPFDPDYPFGN
ncbi:MAG: protein kinase [Spartobacteria bacterium]